MVCCFEKSKCSVHKDVTFYKEKSFVNGDKVVYNILCVCLSNSRENGGFTDPFSGKEVQNGTAGKHS